MTGKVVRRWLALVAVAVLAFLILMIVAGGAAKPAVIWVPVVAVPAPEVPVANTWTRSANYTTCTQWLQEMTPAQRTSMLRPLLPIMRMTVDTAATDGLELLPAFVDAVSATCRSSDIGDPSEYVVTAAAAFAFTMDKRLQH